VTGGVFKLALFIWIIVIAFKEVGEGVQLKESVQTEIHTRKSRVVDKFETENSDKYLGKPNRSMFALKRSRRALEITSKPNQNESMFTEKFLHWALGASLFSHIASFVSVSYFDQMIVFFYLLLALIVCVNPDKKRVVKKSLLKRKLRIKILHPEKDSGHSSN
jgi:hypothetical protein